MFVLEQVQVELPWVEEQAKAEELLLAAQLFVASQTAKSALCHLQIAACVEYDENLSYSTTASMLKFCSGRLV